MVILKEIKKMYNMYKRYKLKKHILNNNHSSLSLDESKKQLKKFKNKGFNLAESYLFDFKNNDYRDYITTWEAYKPRLNNNKYFLISDDKYLFSIVFGKYIDVAKTYGLINYGKVVGIENLNLDNANLYDFIIQENGLVIKDRFGSDGFAVYVFYVREHKIFYKDKMIDKEELEKIVNGFKSGIIQSRIHQGVFENRIFDKSINTIRVVSLRRKDAQKHEVVAALQRIGSNRSQPVDNFNQGGYSALIDIKTGKLGKMISLFDIKDGKKQFYGNHPDTDAKVEGEVIPHWDELVKKVEEITEKLPFYESVAWDFVLKDDGFALIEINMKSSLNLFQIHHGMRNELLGQKYKEHGWLD
ncbi:MAG: hypothetical protein IJ215_05210 [Clostridia bacterium]|nr:hypothetical protein [Clostridia bacterium]